MESLGGFCGGIFVDKVFMWFLFNKVLCLDEFLCCDCFFYKMCLFKDWEDIKCIFGEDEGISLLKLIDLYF